MVSGMGVGVSVGVKVGVGVKVALGVTVGVIPEVLSQRTIPEWMPSVTELMALPYRSWKVLAGNMTV